MPTLLLIWASIGSNFYQDVTCLQWLVIIGGLIIWLVLWLQPHYGWRILLLLVFGWAIYHSILLQKQHRQYQFLQRKLAHLVPDNNVVTVQLTREISYQQGACVLWQARIKASEHSWLLGKNLIISDYQNNIANYGLGNILQIKGRLTVLTPTKRWFTGRTQLQILRERNYLKMSVKEVFTSSGNNTKNITKLVRHYMVKAISERVSNSEVKSTLVALLLGYRQAQYYGDEATKQVLETYRLAGLLHLFSVSGMHIVLFVLACYGIINILIINWHVKWLSVLLLATGYVILTGSDLPALRALLIFVFYVVGNLFFRKNKPLHLFFLVAFIIIFIEYSVIFKVSFQLTFAVTLSLILANTAWQKIWTNNHWFDRFLPKALYTKKQRLISFYLDKLVAIVWFNSIAWLVATPIIYYHYQQLYIIGLLLSPLVGLAIVVIFYLGLFSCLIYIFSANLAAGLNQINTVLISNGYQYIYYVQQRTVNVTPNFFSRRAFVFCNQYGGGGLYLPSVGGCMIDGGSSYDSYYFRRFFRRTQLPFDSWIITHHDNQHIGAVLQWFRQYKGNSNSYLRQIALPAIDANLKITEVQQDNINQYNMARIMRKVSKSVTANKLGRYLLASEGSSWLLEQSTSRLNKIVVVYNGWQDDEAITANDRAVVLLWYWGFFRILIAQDCSELAWNYLQYNLSLKYYPDIIVMDNSHEKDSTNMMTAIKQWRPIAILASSGKSYQENRSKQWRKKIAKYTRHLLMLDEVGEAQLQLMTNSKLKVSTVTGTNLQLEK